MDCVTPSHPTAIPHGTSQTITDTLSSIHGDTLFKDGRPMSEEAKLPQLHLITGSNVRTPSGTRYRSDDLSLLLAQNATNERALKQIEREVLSGEQYDWTLVSTPAAAPPPQPKPVRTPRIVPSPKRTPRVVSRSQGPVTSIPLRRAPDLATR